MEPPKQKYAIPVHGLREKDREGGTTTKHEEEGEATPEQKSALPAQVGREREGGGHFPTQRGKRRR